MKASLASQTHSSCALHCNTEEATDGRHAARRAYMLHAGWLVDATAYAGIATHVARRALLSGTHSHTFLLTSK